MLKKLFPFLISFVLLLTSCGVGSSAPVPIDTVSPQIGEAIPAPTTNLENENSPILTLEQKNALEDAVSYLRYSDFSRVGLIDQLLYEGYSEEASQWAADNVDVDWMVEALECAMSYIEYSGFSYTGLISQLDYEGFTAEQAAYGVDNCGADWNAEALETAESYLKYSSFSREGLADQLDYEGFTVEQIEYALDGVGYYGSLNPAPQEEPSAEILYEAILMHSNGDTANYVAEIKNTSSFPIEISDMSIDVENGDGTLLKVVDYISASPRIVAPGESSFVCEQLISALDTDIVASDATVANLEFDIEKAVMPELAVELVSINLTVRTSFPNIVGKVKNSSPEDISNLFISVPVYSSEGILQTVITGMIDVDAGEESSFDQLGIYADYRLDYSNSYLGKVSLYTLY